MHPLYKKKINNNIKKIWDSKKDNQNTMSNLKKYIHLQGKKNVVKIK